MVQAYILLKGSSGTERNVCKKIAEFDEVLVAGIIYGEYDVIAKISVKDMGALEAFLSVKLRKLPSVLVTSTMIIAREYKGKKSAHQKVVCTQFPRHYDDFSFRLAPHSGQNFELTGIRVWHLGQISTTCLCTGPYVGTKTATIPNIISYLQKI